MPSFTEFIFQNLERNGYRCIEKLSSDVFMRTPEGDIAWICYLDKIISPETIRRAFEFKGHVLFVVDDKLIPQEIESREKTPMWLRVLHGLYLGRIYTWNGRFLYGLHFDYDTGDISESPAIQPDSLLLVETGTWLRGWPGTYKLARFYDRAWWNESAEWNPRSDERVRQEYEDRARRERQQYQDNWQQKYGSWTPPKGDSGYQSAGHADWKQNKQSYDYYGGTGKSQPPPPKQEAPGRDFLGEFRACKSEAELKKLYRKVAREFHPDMNKEPNATVMMQFINAAYEKAKLRWE